MFWKKDKVRKGIEWHELSDKDQLQTIIEESKTQPVIIYKHSIRCGISSMVMDRLERSWTPEGHDIKPYFLDLITYREISNAVADTFQVYHESPQVILIKNGKAVYDASHMQVSFESIKNAAL